MTLERAATEVVVQSIPCQNSNVLKRPGVGLLKDFIWGRNLQLRKWERIVTQKQNSTFSPIFGWMRITVHWWETSEGKVDFWGAPPCAFSRKPQDNWFLITAEHLCIMHAAPTLVSASLSCRFTILGGRWIICTITSHCVICRKVAAKPSTSNPWTTAWISCKPWESFLLCGDRLCRTNFS